MLNNSFKDLVKKYELYKSKRQIKKLTILLAVLSVIAAGFLLIYNMKSIVNIFKKEKPTTTITNHKQNQLPKTQQNKQEEVVSEDSKPLDRVKVQTPTAHNLPDKVYKRDTTITKNGSDIKLQIKERKNLYNLLTADKNEHSYKSAIDIADFFFNEKNYEKAVIWAIKASKKDPKESRPWIIYAKSKVALGKTMVAKKALSLYLKHMSSKEAQDLLDSL